MAEMSGTGERLQSMIAELNERSYECRWYAKANHWNGLCLMILGISSSFVAGICGISGADGRVVGGIALVPGFVAIVGTTFRFEARSDWYFRKYNALTKLRRSLQFEENVSGDGIRKAVHDWDDLDSKMQKEWNRDFRFKWSILRESRGQRRTGLEEG